MMYIDHIKQYWKNTFVEKQQIALNKIKGNSTYGVILQFNAA